MVYQQFTLNSPVNLKGGKGRWFLNNDLLTYEDYIEQIVNIIDDITKEHNNPTLRWNLIRMHVRGFSIQYATRKKKARNLKLHVLEKKLNEIENKQSSNIQIFVDAQKQANLVQNKGSYDQIQIELD